MKKLYLTIHAHFYQPPRENPWTNTIDLQPSAAPFKNWNERILHECYTPNAKAKIKNSKGKTIKYVNNYKHISFNFGPTLVDWFMEHSPKTLKKIVEADRESISRLGHGNAIAQAYNHIIMPLASQNDRITQIKWGLKHFKETFGRAAEGMWLAETAICKYTVKALIDNNVKFTILSPTQARKIRSLKDDDFIDVSHNSINPKIPYRLYDQDQNGKAIPSRHIDVFFYDGPIAVDISFQDLLSDSYRFGERLTHSYDKKSSTPQLLNIATDGEAYGHHKKFGEMALAYLYENVLAEHGITPVNYGYFLEKFPPKHEVVLKSGPVGLGTAWSCSHGVGRWYRDCGCQTGGEHDWNQRWRTPLREALNILKEDMDHIFETKGCKYFHDVWEARNNYIDVLVNDTPETRKRFIEENCRFFQDRLESEVWNLLEIQRNCMLMFTSCGWFFSDISGIETVQIMAYAARAIELAKKYSKMPIEKRFKELLGHAHSNIKKYKTGADIYRKQVVPLKPKKRH